jgi:putative transposase
MQDCLSLACVDSNVRPASASRLEVTENKTVPYVPISHPFVERLIDTVRRECSDRTLFWNKVDLAMKLFDFQHY